jgi:8-oxo-dGTP pyrophosphatase MutT (NUDIX family)
MPLSLDHLRDVLSSRLEQPLPGHEAHETMAPRYSARQEALSIRDKECREAGVLALLLPRPEDAPAVVLTVRRQDLSDHAGQISFPGGRREGAETLAETALREANEEVALNPESVTLLGTLTPLYIPPSNFCVHPQVGVVAHDPALTPTDREVKRVLRVPLSRLLDPETRVVEPWTLHGTTVEVPYYDVEAHTVWGATAMMLAELLAVVQEIVDTAPHAEQE